MQRLDTIRDGCLRHFAALLVGLASCGVRDYPHPQKAYDPNNDLGPIGGNDAAQPPPPPTMDAATPDTGNGPSSDVVGPPPEVDASSDAVLPPPPIRDAAAEPAPPSGITITLGGTAVPKENAIAFIHVGHSNMAGRATSPAADAPYFLTQTDPRAWMYHVGTMPQPALEPGTAGDGSCGNCGGPGTALLKQAAALAPGKYFVSLGFGKASAYCTQYLPGALYYDSLIAAPRAIKGRVTFGAIVIMLGITERHGTSADITGYSTCINQLVTAIRNDVGEPNLPLLITDYEMQATGELAPTSAFAQSIIPEIRKIPSVVSNSALVPTDGLGMQDDHHFNFQGHKVWTARVLQIMKTKGWAPWAP
jgi:hypothetical protein